MRNNNLFAVSSYVMSSIGITKDSFLLQTFLSILMDLIDLGEAYIMSSGGLLRGDDDD